MRRSKRALRIEWIDGADQIVPEPDQIVPGIGLIPNADGTSPACTILTWRADRPCLRADLCEWAK
jgi:hypothetical protein